MPYVREPLVSLSVYDIVKIDLNQELPPKTSTQEVEVIDAYLVNIQLVEPLPIDVTV